MLASFLTSYSRSRGEVWTRNLADPPGVAFVGLRDSATAAYT